MKSLSEEADKLKDAQSDFADAQKLGKSAVEGLDKCK